MTLIGKVLAGRYEIIEEVGSGGMAVVYKAKCQLLNRFVAVKVLRPDLQNDEEFVRRFNVEAQAAASLTHPNIVSIYDVGNEDGLHYIVMEYIEGKTLKDYIEAKLILPWREASDYAIQIARGLEQAHKNSIIHRDVKPHNIIMTADGVLKVTDFGIARANVQSTVTCEDSAIGSVHYISPEQARGGYTDERSDIYSLGVVLYEMLTGKVPFDSDRPVTVAIMHLQEKPVMPRELNLSIPRPLENIVMKAMSKEVSARYKNVSEMIADLQDVLNDPSREVCEVSVTTEKSYDMGETKRMPAVGVDIISDRPERPSDIRQTDVRPITDNGLENPEDSEDSDMAKRRRTRRTETYIDKKKEKNVTLVAVLSALALLLVVGFAAFFGLGFADSCTGTAENTIVIPKVEGLLYEDALSELQSETRDKEYKFSLIKEQQIESDKPEGVILSQDPAPESKIKMSDEVIIKVKVSAGGKKMSLGDYTNDDYRDAELELQNKGLKVQVERKHSDDIPKDAVMGQNPVAGAMVSKNSTVILYVSNGPDDEEGSIELSDYTGKTRAAAENALDALGLEVAIVERYSNTVAKGSVISQSPIEGVLVKEGKTVTLYVSKGPDTAVDAKEPDKNKNDEKDNGKQDEGAKKSTTITIYGPKDKESALVQVNVNGSNVYSATMKKGASKAIKLESKSNTIQVEVLYDGVSQGERTVTLY